MHTAHLSRLHTGAPAPPQIWCTHTYTCTYRHTQSKTHICLCTCGVGGWVRGCYGQVGRKVVCWCIDMLGEVRVYTHICVPMWGFARVGVNVYAYALRNTLSNTYVLTSNISTKKTKKTLWQYNDIETKVWCELYKTIPLFLHMPVQMPLCGLHADLALVLFFPIPRHYWRTKAKPYPYPDIYWGAYTYKLLQNMMDENTLPYSRPQTSWRCADGRPRHLQYSYNISILLQLGAHCHACRGYHVYPYSAYPDKHEGIPYALHNTACTHESYLSYLSSDHMQWSYASLISENRNTILKAYAWDAHNHARSRWCVRHAVLVCFMLSCNDGKELLCSHARPTQTFWCVAGINWWKNIFSRKKNNFEGGVGRGLV